MLKKDIIYFGKSCTLACDANCSKAWGSTKRPRKQLTNNPDDYLIPPDQELGEAPEKPGTYEGDDTKPIHPEERLNRWCARACERSTIVDAGAEIILPDLSTPRYNIPR